MISSLKIQNFQSHKNSRLDFHEGLNVIVGESDHGKSAIVRALRWLMKNRPTGDSFRSDWSGNTKVEVQLSNDNKVTRRKTDSVNEYQVNESKLQSFGSGVPDQVVETLKMSDINLQTQFESHYLISNSPGEVAQHFNKIAGLDQIDLGLKNVKSWTSKINKKIEYGEEMVDKLQKELDHKYSHVDSLESEVDKLEKQQEELYDLQRHSDSLNKILDELYEINEKLAQYQELLDIEDNVNGILKLHEEVDQIDQKYKELDDLTDSIWKTQQQIRQLKEYTEIEDDVNYIIKEYDDLHILTKEKDQLATTIQETKKYSKLRAKYENEIESLEEDLHSNMEGICPFCGQLIQGGKYEY